MNIKIEIEINLSQSTQQFLASLLTHVTGETSTVIKAQPVLPSLPDTTVATTTAVVDNPAAPAKTRKPRAGTSVANASPAIVAEDGKKEVLNAEPAGTAVVPAMGGDEPAITNEMLKAKVIALRQAGKKEATLALYSKHGIESIAELPEEKNHIFMQQLNAIG